MYKTLLLPLLLAAAPAAADWSYDPAPLPAGQAIGPGTNGFSVMVECANGGLPAVVFRGYDPGASEEIFVVEVDNYGEVLVGADCSAASCLLAFDTMEEAESFVSGMQYGSNLMVGLYRRGTLSEVPLRGSSAAIDRVLARDCSFM
ncbi:hypothetical protein [Pelagovum pacificum]|uniref:Uncharacterized protein n=1 Tax=Pelagovum pacificum TaxID=2588711 RepID=A0A5C5GE20_9RHOB|nr:hypothetical protein [Pelagovum pacificum]QQA41338.1 hypothetical protein I8N54_10900 [Pelagovum pacificum]TNY31856.1 hypothetical protein FHY64_00695 [Pelagovum pacificum]